MSVLSYLRRHPGLGPGPIKAASAAIRSFVLATASKDGSRLKAGMTIVMMYLAGPAHADVTDSRQLENTRATLVARHDAVVPGKPAQLGILLEPQPGWHTYWENPGDAGLATELKWTLPEGYAAEGIDWPAPARVSEGPLVTFSYTGPVFLPVTLKTPEKPAGGDPSFRVKAQWLVCKDICLPESAELAIELPVAEAAKDSASAPLFARHAKQKPRKLGKPGGYSAEGGKVTLSFPLNPLKLKGGARHAEFFPRQQNVLRYDGEAKLSQNGDYLSITLPATEEKPKGRLDGILTLSDEDGEHSFDVGFEPGAPPAAPAKRGAPDTPSGWLPAMLLALLGGMVLNLMPCVLPVLSLKALDLAQQRGHERAASRRHGVAYTLGVLLTFTLIGGLLLALRHGGQAVGWGYQMQSPGFVTLLAYLLFIVGLNLAGFFHLPVLMGNLAAGRAMPSLRGSFTTGMLATLVATPCTAPFMASAVGAALTMSALPALLIFEALGLGLALPFLLLSLFPASLRLLPKPGAWMETFRQFLAFPIFASVIWLLWILAQQAGADGLAVALAGMLALTFVIWLKVWLKRSHKPAMLIGIALVLLTLPAIGRLAQEEAVVGEGFETAPYSKEKLASLRAANKPVYVDATAAWCITCKVNERLALNTPRTRALFKQRGVTLLIADWTRRNDDITAFLAEFGYKGVPLNVYFPPARPPIVLPQLLTEETIASTLIPSGDSR